MKLKVYFTDFFEVDENDLEEYGALNISLINDMPLFIDPFLLFNSELPEYKELHKEILKYLSFLKEYSTNNKLDVGLLKSWYQFPEIKQNWLGYSQKGNGGTGLGPKFAKALNDNLKNIFSNFGEEKITEDSHLEKLCVIDKGAGKDHISDFTTNLIHGYLLEYTSEFAKVNIDSKYLKIFNAPRVTFNYTTMTWNRKEFLLPYFNGDYVLLTPKNILTKDDTWINNNDIVDNFSYYPLAIENDALREQINNYFMQQLPKDHDSSDEKKAILETIKKYPILVDYYIKYKEENGDKATDISKENVSTIETYFVENTQELINELNVLGFYNVETNSYEATSRRVKYIKQVIEDNDGYRFFYDKKGNPISREEDIQILFKLTWFASMFDVNREVNNGRGPVDYKISYGSYDMTLVEFKLAKNKKLKQNLQNQVDIYEKANKTDKSFKVIVFFTEAEFERVSKILKELKLSEDEHIVLIDARRDNKLSASNV